MPHMRLPRKDTIICALLCFACALLSFGLFMVQDGGAFTLREDFDFQQLPFTMALHNQIARGGLAGWCWDLDLGASAIQGFGFYELGSPFFWLSMLAPASAFPFVVGWLYILKYTIAGVTAHLLLRRFVSNPQSATVGALLYAFSGFQTTNLLFYHFHDVVALFPLLLIGLERLMQNKRDWPCFALAVCINALVNYFFFVQSVLFLLLYFGFRFGPGLARERRLLPELGRCFALGVLGVGMAAVLIVPSFVYMLSNPRADGSTLSLSNLLWDPWQFLFQLQGFLLPADAMFDHNAVIYQQWTSTSCWLPLVGCSLAIAYARRKRDWLTCLIAALLLICLSPLLTSAFTLFKSVYQRWWYTLVLMLALASAQVVDTPDEYRVRSSVRICLGLVAAFVSVVILGSAAGIVELFHPDRFALYVGIAVAGLGVAALLFARQKTGTPLMPLAIAVASIVSTALTLHFYRQNLITGELLNKISVEEQNMGTLNALELGTQLQTHDAQYRYATGDNRLTLTGNAAGTSSFSSTVSAASGQLDELFDTPASSVWHLNKATVPGLTELLAGRYHITTDPQGKETVDQHVVNGTTYYVTSEDALPLGVLYDRYVTLEDVAELPLEQRALALLQAPAIADANTRAVEGYAKCASTGDLDLSEPVDVLVDRAAPHGVEDFWRNDYGFGFTTDAGTPCLAYLAIPHDAGWTAYVDGSKYDLVIDSAGMMVLPLTAGAHEVRFAYTTPGLTMGIVGSAASWATFIVLCVRLRACGRAVSSAD